MLEQRFCYEGLGPPAGFGVGSVVITVDCLGELGHHFLELRLVHFSLHHGALQQIHGCQCKEAGEHAASVKGILPGDAETRHRGSVKCIEEQLAPSLITSPPAKPPASTGAAAFWHAIAPIMIPATPRAHSIRSCVRQEGDNVRLSHPWGGVQSFVHPGTHPSMLERVPRKSLSPRAWAPRFGRAWA